MEGCSLVARTLVVRERAKKDVIQGTRLPENIASDPDNVVSTTQIP